MEKSIIEYSEIGRKWLVFKMPGKEIKKGTSLLVRPGQLALVYSNGELLREYLPGKYSLDEIAVSKKTSLESKLGNSDNVIATDIYYINTSLFMNNGWGTKDPVIKRDNELGIIRVTAFGNYSFKISFDRYQSELLFKIIADRSERGSIIITTNLSFSEWTTLFENTAMVAAMIDRLTFHSYVLDMNGESYRLEQTRKARK